jgi:hypothetical protein
MFVEQELLPPTTLYNSGGGGVLQEPANDLVSTDSVGSKTAN